MGLLKKAIGKVVKPVAKLLGAGVTPSSTGSSSKPRYKRRARNRYVSKNPKYRPRPRRGSRQQQKEQAKMIAAGVGKTFSDLAKKRKRLKIMK